MDTSHSMNEWGPTPLSENAALMQRLRANVTKQDKEFMEAVKANRPTMNAQKELNAFDTAAVKNSKEIAKLAMAIISLQAAVKYAQTMLQQDLGMEGASLSANDVMGIANKMMRLQTMKLVAAQIGIPKRELERAINNIIDWEFPASKPAAQGPMESLSQVIHASRNDHPAPLAPSQPEPIRRKGIPIRKAPEEL